MLNSVLCKQNFNWKVIIYAITVVLLVVLPLVMGSLLFDNTKILSGDTAYYPATVTSIDYDDSDIGYGTDSTVIFRCVIKKGSVDGVDYAGKEVVVLQQNNADEPANADTVGVGDKVLLLPPNDMTPDDPYDDTWVFADYNRTTPIIVLAVIFAILLVIFGRIKGLKTLITLFLTCYTVFLVFIPALLRGMNAHLMSVLSCIYIIVMTLIIMNGYSKKTFAAIIGCASGVAVSGVIVIVMTHFLHLTGVTDDLSMPGYLSNLGINIKSLTFAGILLGCLGAVMDVSVSISSSLKELHDQVESPTFSGLVKSGITIGRDVMGTMANTLVLAYIGSEVATTISIINARNSLSELFSTEYVVTELLQMLAGSIGILLTIPLTAVFSAALYTGRFNGVIKFKSLSTKRDKYFVEEAVEPSLYERSTKKTDKNAPKSKAKSGKKR